MSKTKYLIGVIKNFLNFNISKLALIDNKSQFHPTVIIYRNTKVISSKIDAFTYIAPGSELLYANIGKFCSIGRECFIGLPMHSIQNISSSPIFTSKHNAIQHNWTDKDSYREFKQVNLGNDVWIGNRATIMGGITIGDGAVIGTGAIVTNDVPEYAIVAGIPARVIKYRFNESVINKLLEIKWWNLPEQFLKANIHAFNQDEISIQFLEEIFSMQSDSPNP